ncbi:PEGA domain-containing protein [candidate division KSB1 bacterium]|nr:PEGA domain-containing protein [candidate division KSB1 bacterium]
MSRNHKLLPGLIVLIFLMQPQNYLFAAQEETGMLSIHSEISGLTVWVDSIQIGQTPIDSLPLAPGLHTLRVKHPDPHSWMAKDWENSVQIHSGKITSEVVQFPKSIWISSQPEYAQLFIHNQLAGLTPRYILCPDSGLALRFEKPGFQSKYLFLNPNQGPFINITMMPIPDFKFEHQDESVFQSRKVWMTGLISLTSGIAGYVFKHLAERSYDRYLEASRPSDMNTHYDRAVFYDRISGGCYIACEVHFGLALFFSIQGTRGH